MKIVKLLLIFIIAVCMFGCASNEMSSNSNYDRKNNSSQTNSGGNYADNGEPTKVEANVGMGNIADNVSATKPTPAVTPPPPIEKKDEGLFSFPPPKAIDVSESNIAGMMNSDGETNFAQISEKLAAALKNGEYKDNFYYFWNGNDEFAIVTKMERINLNGYPLAGNARWNNSADLPTANDWASYWEDLFYGKRVYYRVFAFVVTAKRKRSEFLNGVPAEFITAASWGEKGDSRLGDGDGTTAIENATVTGKYRVFALLYLFVNHTSLDAPKAINNLGDGEQDLRREVNMEVEDHLHNSKIHFGG